MGVLREEPPLSEEAAEQRNPLQLAYLGDAVWELLVSSRLVGRNYNVRHIHREAVHIVSAKAQSAAFARIQPLLSGKESAIAQRGRNTHVHHSLSRNQDPAEYAAATALECLFGYLYLTGQEARMLTLFQQSQEV